MSEAGFTKGPWTWIGDQLESRDELVLCVSQYHPSDAKPSDRALIAAAPELLEALQAFMALDRTFTTTCVEGLAELAAQPGRSGDMPRAVQKARAAINKALGRI